MKIPLLARYNNVVATAYDFVLKHIQKYPINIFELIQNFNWKLISYEELALNNNCTISDICECFGTDGYSIYNGNTYIIAYNNKIKSQGRINFTLAHEIGHIVLNHHKDFDVTDVLKNDLSKKEYKILENEANCFARNLLAPAPLVRKISIINRILDIDVIFNITYPAMVTRLNLQRNDLYYLSDTQIEIMENRFHKYKCCRKCKTKYLPYTYIYCPNCGNKKLIEGVGFMIYKSEIELDENKKAKKCPRCENEEILEGNYCKICGLELFNKCTQMKEDEYGNQYYCDETCDANARYCHKCGNPTSFYTQKLLKDYNYEKNSNNNSLDNNNYDNSDDLPF